MANYDEIFKEMNAVYKLDIAAARKWINPKSSSVFRLPQVQEDIYAFLSDWIGTCPVGTEKQLKEVEKNARKIAKQEGALIGDFYIALLKARKLAVIKRDYTQNQLNTLRQYLKEKKLPEKRGHTHMSEIIQIMNLFLSETAKLCPNAIAKYENVKPRRKV